MLWHGAHGLLATLVARRSTGNRTAHRDFLDQTSALEAGQPLATRFDSGRLVEARFTTSDVVQTIHPEHSTSVARPFPSQTTQRGPNCTIKRVFDFVFALTGILALTLVFVAVAIAVTVDTPGPILFRQWRGGHNGRPFQIWKFRTMTCLEDGADVCQVSPGDARITRVGRFLRRTSIDEFPQLFNVLKGDMSLVGPRPHALVHDAMYSRLITEYAERQSVRPGMTGWAQVNGCRGATRDIAAMERRIERDLEYIRRWSFRLDLVIMVKTVNELVRPSNAC
jgi:putative colanic acid biosysnthesis UDP-glucose lipid carrier transferase